MDYEKLADLLFPTIDKDLEYYENLYPKRDLKDGAIVTRFAPSPTGFLHMGSVFTSVCACNLAKKSGGKYILRIEDTDQKRLVPGAIELIVSGLKKYGVDFDEGMDENGNDFGNYGPYKQSQRKELYMAMAKHLVKMGRAYPCFCDEEVLNADRQVQEANKELIGYYGNYAHCRDLTLEEVKENLAKGKKFCIRYRCESNSNKKVIVHDAVRGKLILSDNFMDVVILKSDFLPPYNFAHVCDDHFMRMNLVVRGDEYLPSITQHIQLFQAMGFEPIQYAHLAPIQKMDNGSRRKISKRKDPEADVQFYVQEGYPLESVKEYLLTIANSNYEDWHKQNPDLSCSDFEVKFDKMSISGALFDMPKLVDVSKTVISKFTAEHVYEDVLEWAKEYDKELFNLLSEKRDFSIKMFSIERGTQKPRKDIGKWGDVKEIYSYFFNELYSPTKESFVFDSRFSTADIVDILTEYEKTYDSTVEKQDWFNNIKVISKKFGFADDMKAYKANPENYKGHYGDVSSIIRMGLTTRSQTPDMFDICKLFGEKEVARRMELCCNLIK